MKKELSYKGYYGSLEYSLEDDTLYGKVIDINGLLSYEGQYGVK
ncbi:antitoxin HicB [Lactobacillus crispatus]